VKAYLSKRAARAVERIDARWRTHADHPGTFAAEFLVTVERLEASASPGIAVPTTKRPRLRRLLMPTSQCHVYFEIDETKQVIQILHVWDARRERAPNL
jgi:hypothetical protein